MPVHTPHLQRSSTKSAVLAPPTAATPPVQDSPQGKRLPTSTGLDPRATCISGSYLPAQARQYVGQLPWVSAVDVTISAESPSEQAGDAPRPPGLRRVAHIIAVASCKGGGSSESAPSVPPVTRVNAGSSGDLNDVG